MSRYCLKNSVLVEFEVNRTRNTASKIKTAIKLIPDKIMPTRAFCGRVRSPLESAPRIKASPAKTSARFEQYSGEVCFFKNCVIISQKTKELRRTKS